MAGCFKILDSQTYAHTTRAGHPHTATPPYGSPNNCIDSVITPPSCFRHWLDRRVITPTFAALWAPCQPARYAGLHAAYPNIRLPLIRPAPCQPVARL